MAAKKNVKKKKIRKGRGPRFCEYEILYLWYDCRTRRRYRALFDNQGKLVGGYSFREDEDEPKKVVFRLQRVVIPGVCPIYETALINDKSRSREIFGNCSRGNESQR